MRARCRPAPRPQGHPQRHDELAFIHQKGWMYIAADAYTYQDPMIEFSWFFSGIPFTYDHSRKLADARRIISRCLREKRVKSQALLPPIRARLIRIQSLGKRSHDDSHKKRQKNSVYRRVIHRVVSHGGLRTDAATDLPGRRNDRCRLDLAAGRSRAGCRG